MSNQSEPIGSSSPSARFLQAALAVLDAMHHLPNAMVTGGGIDVLRSTLLRAKHVVEQEPTSVIDAACIQLVQGTITTLGNFAGLLPELQQHPAYEAFLQEAKEMKRLIDPLNISDEE